MKSSFDAIALKYELEYLLGRRTDIHTFNFLGPFLRVIRPLFIGKKGESRFLIKLLFRQTHAKFMHRWISKNLDKNDIVLDVGAKRFPYTRYQNVKAIFGVDLFSESGGYLGWAGNELTIFCRQTNLFPVIADCEGLPFKDNSFDKIVMIEVIEHIEKDNLAISELARVLKQNGRLFLTTPNGNEVKKTSPFHLRHYTPRELKILLNRYFDNVNICLKFPNPDLYFKQYLLKNFFIRFYWHHIYMVWHKLYGEKHYPGGYTLVALSSRPRK